MKKGVIIAIVAVVLLTIVAVVVLSNTYFSPYEKQIRLAYKYLDEGNYEEAILAFDKAIQIDAKKPKAYIGKADVYITRCDENAITDATATLKLGYEQSEDNRDEIVKAVIRLSDTLKEKGQEQLAYEFSKIMYEIVSDERIADWMVDFIKDYVENTEEPDNKFFVDTFKEIYNITKSDKLVEWLKKYADENLNDPENKFSAEIVDLLNFVYETNKDESIKQIINDNFEAYGKSILKELYYAYYSGNENAVIDFMNDTDTFYNKICRNIKENNYIWYSENNTLDNEKGIALYKNKLLYIGEWKNGHFEGEGKYYYHGDSYSAMVEGTFKNGAPNGVCTEKIFQGIGINLNPDVSTKSDMHDETYKGNYINGLRDGSFEYSKIDYTTDHLNLVAGVSINYQRRVNEYSGLYYVDGVAQKMSSGNGVAETPWYRPTTRTIAPYKISKPYTGEKEYAAGYSTEKISY